MLTSFRMRSTVRRLSAPVISSGITIATAAGGTTSIADPTWHDGRPLAVFDRPESCQACSSEETLRKIRHCHAFNCMGEILEKVPKQGSIPVNGIGNRTTSYHLDLPKLITIPKGTQVGCIVIEFRLRVGAV
jgi:hypothetical protein